MTKSSRVASKARRELKKIEKNMIDYILTENKTGKQIILKEINTGTTDLSKYCKELKALITHKEDLYEKIFSTVVQVSTNELERLRNIEKKYKILTTQPTKMGFKGKTTFYGTGEPKKPTVVTEPIKIISLEKAWKDYV